MPKKINLEKKLLHYTGCAISDYQLINTGDNVLVCLSGGKDSFTMLHLLLILQRKTNFKFSLKAFTLDPKIPGFPIVPVRTWLEARAIPYDIYEFDVYGLTQQKIKEGEMRCSFCSRMRRGIIYSYAKQHGFNKIALGHHRDDAITSLLMSILYGGEIASMPPKLLSKDKENVVIRPLIYCQENDIRCYAQEKGFPISQCNALCTDIPQKRKEVHALIMKLAEENPKVPSNILHALQRVRPSQLMDKDLFPFKTLEELRRLNEGFRQGAEDGSSV